ncbi:MAG TPA: carbohydrate kinase [Rhodanobacteraceae bacterium]|jgi:fructokinase|nr:carbohydrate kinase [Rhodanobacteraceae bacterium]
MNTVCCFGEALIDFHGKPSGAAPVFTAHPGGAPANVSVAVARLGGRAAFVGMFGPDMFGELLLRELAAAGVDTSHAHRTDAANTALAFVSHAADGERDFSFWRPPSADLLFRDADFDPSIFAADTIFHAGSCSMTEPDSAVATLQGMAHARNAGALVSYDMNLRPPLWPRGEDPAPTIWRALECADFVKLSAEELALLAASTGAEDAVFAQLWNAHAKLVVVTDGEQAAHWFTPHASGERRTFPVRAVDTTGAGDAFVGGCLYRFAQAGLDAATFEAFVADADRLDVTLRFASACGALAVTRAGSFAAMPALAEVEALLEQHA